MTILFWFLIAAILYATVGYPVLVLALGSLRRRRAATGTARKLRVDFVIPAHNEAQVIEEKLRNTLAQKTDPEHELRIIVVSDGSSDGTVEAARRVSDERIEILDIQPRAGKVNALNVAIGRLSGDVAVFSDANSMLVPGALDALLSHYVDEEVGGVCGAISVARSKVGGIAKSEGLYWRYDQAVKAAESNLGGAVSAQGSFHSVRSELVEPLPLDAADDFTLSVRAVAAGKRLVFEPRAIAIETVTEKADKELMRRVRSTERGWRALMNHAYLLNPMRTGIYSVQLFSHKLLRRLVPWLLILLFVVSAVLSGRGNPYSAAFGIQLAIYGIAALAAIFPTIRRLPVVRHVFFGVMAMVAMGMGVFNYYRGKNSTLWTPVRE